MSALVSGQIPRRAAAVTTSDTAANIFHYLYVGTGGNIALVTEAGDSVTFNNVPSGGYLWIRTSRINATNTTASQIVGFF